MSRKVERSEARPDPESGGTEEQGSGGAEEQAKQKLLRTNRRAFGLASEVQRLRVMLRDRQADLDEVRAERDQLKAELERYREEARSQ